VTPAVIDVICNVRWIQESYGISATSRDNSSVCPHGNLLLWKLYSLSVVSNEGLYTRHDGDRKGSRVVVAAFRRKASYLGTSSHINVCSPDFVLVANIHLAADRKTNAENDRTRNIVYSSRDPKLVAVIYQLLLAIYPKWKIVFKEDMKQILCAQMKCSINYIRRL